MKSGIFIIVFVILFPALFSCKPEKKLDNIFYCFNNCVRTLPNAPEGMDEQAALVKKLGYDGMAGHISVNYSELRAALDKAGLAMPEIYWGMTLDSTGQVSYNDELKEVISDSKDRDLLVTLFLNARSYMDNKAEGDILIAEGIRQLADFAAPYNVKVAVYPHVNNYCETSEHSARLAKLAGRENVGVVFNTCHFLKVEGEEEWEKKVLNAFPHLFMVSINGADSGNTKDMGWDQLIQPLGEGTFDAYKLIKFLKDNGYNGPIGLQCYNIPQDCETALTKSMKTWNSYRERYAFGK